MIQEQPLGIKIAMKNIIITALILAASISAKAQTLDTAFLSAHQIRTAKIKPLKIDIFDTDSITHIGYANICSDGVTHFDINIIFCNDNASILKTYPLIVKGADFATLQSSIQATGGFLAVLTYYSNNYLTTPTKQIIFK